MPDLVRIPPGRYFIGDPCRVSPSDEAWERFVDDLWPSLQPDKIGSTFLGDVVALVADTGGDFVFFDEDDFPYPIDTGLIAVVPCSANEEACMNAAASDLGRIVTLTEETLIELDDEFLSVGGVLVDLHTIRAKASE